MDRFIQISAEIGEDTDSLPFYTQRSIMLTNIIRRMRTEIEDTGRTPGGVSLAAELDKLWGEVWARGRLDIPGTKEFARIFDIGGPQWLVGVLVEKMASQVYSEEVSRCVEMVFSLLHIDLPACTLALLLHLLPRLLAGEGCERHLSYPTGRSLARLTVSCLAASLQYRSSSSYSTKRKFRTAELGDLCNSPRQPIKLRKLLSSDPAPVDHVFSKMQIRPPRILTYALSSINRTFAFY